MSCTHAGSVTLPPPTPAQSVYREDCTQCFDSIDDPDGLNVCLQCFNGGCAGDNHHDRLHAATSGHPLVLNIRRTRKVVNRDEPPLKMSKLAIAAETEEDRYDTATTVKCLDCDVDLDKASPPFSAVVDGIMSASTFSRKEEVKAWEQELTSCEHILTIQQEPARTIESGDLGHCSSCELKENLWLCLVCGNLGCGRKQMGGVEGNSHGLAHALESGHVVAVKLGSITPEGNADVYCYKCDEECVDEEIGAHLAHWGIKLAERQKTELSLTEMQIEQNMKWDFSMTGDDGRELKPLFGPGLTGLRNLGNSCYLASIIQCLFDLPAFRSRYYDTAEPLPVVPDPAADLETQLRKMADGLLSGRYSNPDPQAGPVSPPPGEGGSDARYQRGLAPAMLKHLIGRGHAEFSTMRQQDAFEFLQHLFTLISRANHSSGAADPTRVFKFATEHRLQCLGCKRVRYTTTEQDNIFIDVPKEKVAAGEGQGDSAPDAYRPVTLAECLDRFTAPETVELVCEACGAKEGFTKQTLFKTLPDVLAVNANKMAVVNWVPVKIDVPILVPEGEFSLEKYMSSGLQPGEEELPEAPPAGQKPAFVPDAAALEQLEGMGFPRARCERGLHATGNSDAGAAMEWIFAHMEDPDIDAPVVLEGGAAPEVDAEKVGMLMAMGFAEGQAKKALRETGGDAERAVEWVFSHPDDTGDDDAGAGAEAGPGPGAEREVAGTTEPGRYKLQSIVCHKGTSIHAGHYVAFIRKKLEGEEGEPWVLFNDEKVVEGGDVGEMSKFAYVYFFKRAGEGGP
ncbi:related to ubiquitin thiolesterase [Cephalotrichum gorgonifer]|uniref:Ubiquitin carboxyl-terminal hydrolase n=1 Tax=Cephalotrichum gorgonifer TaxID=2041049 RepID=A0AAE8SZM0_9PEZI|nr:related to ubiquitin thiolesterase [Cephalotrichum gorgonifer]